MPRMGVIGGGPIGLATAMLAAERGWDTVVFERDTAPVPASVDEAWKSWERNAVAQFRMAHVILPRGMWILRQSLPGVFDAIRQSGGVEWSFLDFLPPGVLEREEDDERLISLGARRPVYEHAFGSVAARHPGVEVRRGFPVEALVRGESVVGDVVHVAGVIAGGHEEPFDVVIDAGGRRSRVPEMISAVGGGEPKVKSEDSRFTYYGRHYHSTGSLPRPFAPDLLVVGSFAVLLLPGDSDTWSVTIYTATSDRALRAVRDNDVFDRVLSAIPSLSGWVAGEPLTDVEVMSGVLDRQRDYVVDGVPIATGIVPVGDAWACTNPSSGRGITFGLLHALHTVEALDAHRGDPLAQSLGWHGVTMSEIEPWHAATLARDRRLVAGLAASANGEAPPPAEGEAALIEKAYRAMLHDPQVFRWVAEYSSCFTLVEDILARPGVVERIEEVVAAHPGTPDEPELTRERLERLLAG